MAKEESIVNVEEAESFTSPFWLKADRAGPCWVWLGAKYPNGYGRHGRGSAHRRAWELAHGPLPMAVRGAGPYVLHSCDNRLCVRPSHLRLGSHSENMSDMTARRRQASGRRNHRAKLTEDDAIDIRTVRALGATTVAIAKAYGIPQSHVSAICLGKFWRSV